VRGEGGWKRDKGALGGLRTQLWYQCGNLIRDSHKRRPKEAEIGREQRREKGGKGALSFRVKKLGGEGKKTRRTAPLAPCSSGKNEGKKK